MSLELLSQLLECPRSKESLVVKEGALYSPKENLAYKNFLGIPWVFKNPDTQLFQWQEHLKNLLHFFHHQSKSLDFEKQKVTSSSKTQRRLDLIQEGLTHNLDVLSQLLSPLLSQGEVFKPQAHSLALEKLPHTQHLNSYTHTLFRDWAWSQKESKQNENEYSQNEYSQIEYSQNEIDEFTQLTFKLFTQKNPKNLVVLGSGASHLSWKLHWQLQSQHTVCVDINPLLFFVAKTLLSGKILELYEFPTAPLHLEHVAVKHKLGCGAYDTKTLKNKLENFDFLFADAISLPFKHQSLHTVLTPWFIDIIPENFENFARRLNRVLMKNATWVNIGPLGYDNFKSQGYSEEEVFEILKSSGFEVEKFEDFEMSYLVSPYSSQTRREKVLGFRAIKSKEAKQPVEFSYLPDWITHKNVPIPKSDLTTEIQLKHQVAYQLLNLINGKRTQEDIYTLMMNSYGMTKELAEQTLVTFLIHHFENKL